MKKKDAKNYSPETLFFGRRKEKRGRGYSIYIMYLFNDVMRRVFSPVFLAGLLLARRGPGHICVSWYEGIRCIFDELVLQAGDTSLAIVSSTGSFL